MSGVKAIIIHGNGGCTAGDIWLPHLDLLGADENTILIGHSSGAVAAMRYAESHRLLGSILVGVCHTDLGDRFEAASGYYSSPWQWEKIRLNQRWIAIFNSTDDPHIPIAEARFVAAQLRCSFFEFTDRGHFVDRQFPEVVELVRRKVAPASAP